MIHVADYYPAYTSSSYGPDLQPTRQLPHPTLQTSQHQSLGVLCALLEWPGGALSSTTTLGTTAHTPAAAWPSSMHCRWDNNLPHESFVESDSRARMTY